MTMGGARHGLRTSEGTPAMSDEVKTEDGVHEVDAIVTVSYTHLTLPTNREV